MKEQGMKNEYKKELKQLHKAAKGLERQQESLRMIRIHEVLKIDKTYEKMLKGISKQIAVINKREAILLGRLS